MKIYDLEVVLVERTDESSREIIRYSIGRDETEKEAREMIELVEAPDPNHIIVI